MQILLAYRPVQRPASMRFIVRFLRLDSPNYRRGNAMQIHPDIPHDEPRHFNYGDVISVGDNEVPSVL
jgi:hypothetical protein